MNALGLALTYLGLALLAVGMWGQQGTITLAPSRGFTFQTDPHASITCGDEDSFLVCRDDKTGKVLWRLSPGGVADSPITDDAPAVVPAVEEEIPENERARCAPPPCSGSDACFTVCWPADTKRWTCSDPSSYELHQTLDGKRHWCQRAPEVAE